MLYPKIEEVKKLLDKYETVPVFYELLMDAFTPVQLFNCLLGRELLVGESDNGSNGIRASE